MRLREILHLLPIAGEYSPLCGRTVLLPALPGSLRLYISGLIFGGFAGKVHTLMVLTTDSRLFPRHPILHLEIDPPIPENGNQL
jgi:hypothetical protein